MHFGFVLWVQFLKYPPVFTQDIGDISDYINVVAVLTVIVQIPALIGTEFLINPSNN